MKKNACILFNSGLPDSISGGDIHIIKLIETLSKKIKVTVIFPLSANKILEKLKRIKGIKLIGLKDKDKIKNKKDIISSYLYRAKKTENLLLKNNFDIIITSTPFFCDVLPLNKLDKNKTRVASYIFHTLPKRNSNSLKEKIINFLVNLQERKSLKIIKNKADVIFTCNSIEKKNIINKIGKKDIKIAGIGIETEPIDAINCKKNKNLAVFVGRLVKQKGIFDLLQITKEIVKTNKNFILKIAGGGPEYENLKEKIKKYNLEKNFLILGFVDDKTKIKLLKSAEYFFFPSYEEGLGIVLIEALYCKCKVICYRLPHYKEFFKDFPEYAQIGNIDEFVKKISAKKNLSKQKKFMNNFEYDQKIEYDIKEILGLF